MPHQLNKKDNLFIYKQSLGTFIVPSMTADVQFAEISFDCYLMDYWIDVIKGDRVDKI